MNKQAGAWREYAYEAGYEDAREWDDAQTAEWAGDVIAGADETGYYGGITAEMDEWARA